MGKLILRNNGVETQFVNGINFSGLTGETNTYILGVNTANGLFEKLNPNGSTTDLEGGGSTFTGGTVSGGTSFPEGLSATTISATTYLNLPNTCGCVTEVTYSELVDKITGDTLSVGGYYLITDFQTCYDQPDFNYDGSPITSGNYKQGSIEPILVLAISSNTISDVAYQPSYPNDKIRYDWTWSLTEVTGGQSFGRITERIDEFNNRTDYDHRTILFKRYRLFTYRPNYPLNGTIELLNDGTVNGTNTSFTDLTVGDVIYIPNATTSYYEIVNISGDTLMSVSGDTITATSPGSDFYKTIEETNGSGYFSYKKTNVKTSDFIEYTTFGDAISNDYAKNNYIGNYTNNYTNVFPGTFLLPNNVFLEGQYESNKFGDYCYNNTFGTDNQNNIWGDYCYENVSTNDIDDNIIGHYFNNNLLNVNLTSNHIGNNFNNNKLLAENGDDFEDNIIGNGFNNNVIYSRFYKNEILDGFNGNVIGDFGNLYRLVFYRNYIRNNFNSNIIKNNYQNNQIGTNFQDNTINGEFIGNTVLNGFNNNTTGNYFSVNNIGNAFNNNTINDDFSYNTTDYYFYNNKISNEFFYNKLGKFFTDNRPSNNTLFGWNDLSTVSTRTYDTFYNSVDGGQLGNKVLGKEFIMFVTSTSQYFKIKFTQWTQGVNNNSYGGGFQYTREEIDSNGNSLGPVITFTKTNYGNEVDVIVPGIIEITRGNQGGIYNVVSEGNWNSNLSPSGTTWNSVYTEPNNGKRFGYNKIGNGFYNNVIDNDFGYGGGYTEGNMINDDFRDNIIGEYFYNNNVGNYFTNNTVGVYFQNNTIKNYFLGNDIGNSFDGNIIGDYFGHNSLGTRNTILDNFKFNQIGNYFGNDGISNDGGNIINNGFEKNTIGDNFIFNLIDESFTNNKIGQLCSFNTFSTNTFDNQIGNIFAGNSFGTEFRSNKIGNYFGYSTFGDNCQRNIIGDYFGNSNNDNTIGGGFTDNQIGNYFGNDGTNTAGGNTILDGFTKNVVTSENVFSYDFSSATLVYDNTVSKTIFDRQGNTPRLMYFDSSDVLNITNIDN